MSLENKCLSISLKLYTYKLKGHSGVLYSLIIAQLIALLFSLGGISHMASSNGELSVTLNVYSASLVIVFTLIWVLFVGIQLPNKRSKKFELSLVTNSISGTISDIGFLLTACILGGITSSLAGILLRVMMYVTFHRSQILIEHFFLPSSELLTGMAAGILYMVLISAIGYLIGMLTDLSMTVIIIIPAIIFGLLRVYGDFMQKVIMYYTAEDSFPLFSLKVITTSIVLFGLSVLLSSRKEIVQ